MFYNENYNDYYLSSRDLLYYYWYLYALDDDLRMTSAAAPHAPGSHSPPPPPPDERTRDNVTALLSILARVMVRDEQTELWRQLKPDPLSQVIVTRSNGSSCWSSCYAITARQHNDATVSAFKHGMPAWYTVFPIKASPTSILLLILFYCFLFPVFSFLRSVSCGLPRSLFCRPLWSLSCGLLHSPFLQSPAFSFDCQQPLNP